MRATSNYRYIDGVGSHFTWASNRRKRWGQTLYGVLSSHGYDYILCCGWPGSIDVIALNRKEGMLLIGTIWIVVEGDEEYAYKAEVSLFNLDDPKFEIDLPDGHITVEVKGYKASKFVICNKKGLNELIEWLSDNLSTSLNRSKVFHCVDARTWIAYYRFISTPKLIYDDSVAKILLGTLIPLDYNMRIPIIGAAQTSTGNIHIPSYPR